MVLYADLKYNQKLRKLREQTDYDTQLKHALTRATTIVTKLHNFPERMDDNNKYSSYSYNQA